MKLNFWFHELCGLKLMIVKVSIIFCNVKYILFITIPLVLSIALCSCLPKPYVESYIESNAVWSEDYQTIAIIRTTYKTQTPEKLFYADETAQGWKNIIYLTDSSLQNRQKIYEWDDEKGDTGQAWLQTVPVYYNSDQKALYYPFLTYGVIRKIQTNQVHHINIPKETIKTIFVYDNKPVYESDGLVPVIEVLPSYSGSYVAVVHQVYIYDSLTAGAYITAIGIFTYAGEYIGFINLSEYNNKDIYLKKNYYPILSGFNVVPTHTETLTVWENDTTFYVINPNHCVDGTKAAYKVTVDSMNLNIDILDTIPIINFSRSTAGGPVSDGNPKKFLVIVNNPEIPNSKEIGLAIQN